MTKSLSAVWLVALVGVFALYAWAIRQDGAPPPRMPDTVTGVTPIDVVQHVFIDNWQATAAATVTPTAAPKLVPTFAYPACPARDKELCRIPPVVVTMTAVPIPGCTAATMATMVPNTVCVWHAATSTAVVEIWK
jgi:hypothetical protein